MTNKKLDSEKNNQLNNKNIVKSVNQKVNKNVNGNKEQEENIKAFRKAYYDLLYHYDNTKEKQQIRALVVRKENIFSKIKNKVKSFLFY